MIPTTDIRDKDRVDKAAKGGMMTVKGELKKEYIEDMINLIRDANGYFADSGS
jgi:hypothetical protein